MADPQDDHPDAVGSPAEGTRPEDDADPSAPGAGVARDEEPVEPNEPA
jgi:hypothetical protein